MINCLIKVSVEQFLEEANAKMKMGLKVPFLNPFLQLIPPEAEGLNTFSNCRWSVTDSRRIFLKAILLSEWHWQAQLQPFVINRASLQWPVVDDNHHKPDFPFYWLVFLLYLFH